MSGPSITDAAVEAVRDAVEREMRSRTYDRHAYDEEVFTEGVADIADAALTAALPHIRRAVIEELAPLIRDLTDPDECWFDHHGGCQAHGYLSLQPGELCPHQEAKNLLRAELEGDGE